MSTTHLCQAMLCLKYLFRTSKVFYTICLTHSFILQLLTHSLIQNKTTQLIAGPVPSNPSEQRGQKEDVQTGLEGSGGEFWVRSQGLGRRNRISWICRVSSHEVNSPHRRCREERKQPLCPQRLAQKHGLLRWGLSLHTGKDALIKCQNGLLNKIPDLLFRAFRQKHFRAAALQPWGLNEMSL